MTHYKNFFRVISGSPDDIRFQRARKGYKCAHEGPHSRQLPTPCEFPNIVSGSVYARTRQEARYGGAESPVSVECLQTDGWIQ